MDHSRNSITAANTPSNHSWPTAMHPIQMPSSTSCRCNMTSHVFHSPHPGTPLLNSTGGYTSSHRLPPLSHSNPLPNHGCRRLLFLHRCHPPSISTTDSHSSNRNGFPATTCNPPLSPGTIKCPSPQQAAAPRHCAPWATSPPPGLPTGGMSPYPPQNPPAPPTNIPATSPRPITLASTMSSSRPTLIMETNTNRHPPNAHPSLPAEE
jgi:hypothetical protein